jgi:hypothetical protein
MFLFMHHFSMAMVFPEPGEWEKRVFLLLDEVECELVFTDDPGPEPLVSTIHTPWTKYYKDTNPKCRLLNRVHRLEIVGESSLR